MKVLEYHLTFDIVFQLGSSIRAQLVLDVILKISVFQILFCEILATVTE